MNVHLKTALRYWETMRWLKPEQLFGRIWFRLARPTIDSSPAPQRRSQSAAWVAPARRSPSLIGPGEFRFLNVDGALAEVGWDGSQREKLWRYNQHYFEDLIAFDAGARRDWHQAILNDWLEKNPPAQGTAWEPYPLSLRIVNWIKWTLNGESLSATLAHSLAIQARFLTHRLEHHLLGNHLFVNAKALIFAGLFFDGPEADRWRRIGFEILKNQFGEQILSDGGQFERTPMYHALALEDVLDLINAARSFHHVLNPSERAALAQWETTAPQMRAWLTTMSHPDGDIAFFNDAAFGVASHRDELEGYANRLEIIEADFADPIHWLSDSGYARLEHANAVLLCDMGKIGPDYLPGHAHADTLSFELSLFGQRVVVNSGTSVYGQSDIRLQQRGTAAHNTVVVAGLNSSDVWKGFRVGTRASTMDVQIFQDRDRLVARGAHDGYRRLPGRPIHHREWQLSSHSLCIHDQVAPGPHPAQAHYHLHPDVRLMQLADHDGKLILADGRQVLWRSKGGPARSEPSTWHPEFGRSEPSTRLVLPLAQSTASLELIWS